MPACSIAPSDRRRQVRLVGNDLLKHCGRQQYYTVQEVKDANRRQGIRLDLGCWSHATFNTHEDFEQYHQSIGETCDYGSMKREMLTSVSHAPDNRWFDFDVSWLEFPDIDWSLFDFIDF